jgi:hypothetical protein
MTKERMFPILLSAEQKKEFPNCPKEISWNLIASHEVQARRNHFQTLEELAERGGLSPAELMCVIHDHDFIPEIKSEHSVMWLLGFMGIPPF